jgi:hypothetical protein
MEATKNKKFLRFQDTPIAFNNSKRVPQVTNMDEFSKLADMCLEEMNS